MAEGGVQADMHINNTRMEKKTLAGARGLQASSPIGKEEGGKITL